MPQSEARLLQVAGSTGGDLGIAEDDLLGRAAAQGANDAGEDLLLADEGGGPRRAQTRSDRGPGLWG